jgi:hypothetical protein
VASVSADGLLGCPAPVWLPIPAYSHAFYQLLAWLGLGVWALGKIAFVHVQDLLAAVSMITLYLLGAHFGGKILGISAILVQLVFSHSGNSAPLRPLNSYLRLFPADLRVLLLIWREAPLPLCLTGGWQGCFGGHCSFAVSMQYYPCLQH